MDGMNVLEIRFKKKKKRQNDLNGDSFTTGTTCFQKKKKKRERVKNSLINQGNFGTAIFRFQVRRTSIKSVRLCFKVSSQLSHSKGRREYSFQSVLRFSATSPRDK